MTTHALRPLAATGAALATAAVLVGCAGATTPGPATSATTGPPAETATATRADTTARPTAGIEPRPVRLTPVGVACELVTSEATGAALAVVVLSGSVDCSVAVPVADRYLNDPNLYIEGNGRYATVDGWACEWPHLDDRSQHGTPFLCTDPTGLNSIRIGN